MKKIKKRPPKNNRKEFTKKLQINCSSAPKTATQINVNERTKPGGMLAKKVSDVVFEDTGIYLSESSIFCCVKDGQAGESPKKMGQTGSLHHLYLQILQGYLNPTFASIKLMEN